jgi:hypothetical protein
VIDKEKLIGFIEISYENIQNQIKDKNDDFSTIIEHGFLKAYSQILFNIKKGYFDISQKKCKWIIYTNTREYHTNDYYCQTKSGCGRETEEYADVGFTKYAPYCPYCGKEIEEVKE